MTQSRASFRLSWETKRPLATWSYLGELNYILVTINKRARSLLEFELQEIKLDGGEELGTIILASRGGIWKITGKNLTPGFSLTGSLIVQGELQVASISSFVQIEVGSISTRTTPADNPGPVSSMVDTQPDPGVSQRYGHGQRPYERSNEQVLLQQSSASTMR